MDFPEIKQFCKLFNLYTSNYFIKFDINRKTKKNTFNTTKNFVEQEHLSLCLVN